MSLLEVENLNISFIDGRSRINAVKSVSLTLETKGSLCIIGESGSGKSVLVESFLGVLDSKAEASGRITFNGKDILGMGPNELRGIRGKGICLIPQNATQAWNPMMRVGQQVREFLIKCGKDEAYIKKEVPRIFEECDLDPSLLRQFPHRLSGGMSQRAMIAMCIAAEPDILIADEPTKGLDGSSKKEVLKLMSSLKDNHSLIVITHDLATAGICEDIIVLYAGTVMESGKTKDILTNPLHPYTKGLIAAHPRNGLNPIPGGGERHDGIGCCFKTRCCHNHDNCNEHIDLHDKSGRALRCCHDHH